MKTGDRVRITPGHQEATGAIVGWLPDGSAVVELDDKYQGYMDNGGSCENYFQHHITAIVVHVTNLTKEVSA
jgi:hypothetical protein